jgi:hypothetical protein
VTVASTEGCFHGFCGLGAVDSPCAEADGRHFVARVEGKGAAESIVSRVDSSQESLTYTSGAMFDDIQLAGTNCCWLLLLRIQAFLHKIDRMFPYESWLLSKLNKTIMVNTG